MDTNHFFNLSLDARRDLNYVNYQADILRKEATDGAPNSFSFIRSLIIENLSDEDEKELVVRFDIKPIGVLSIDSIHLSYLEKRKKTVVSYFNIHLDPELLYTLSEKKIGSLEVLLERNDGTLLAKKEVEFSFLPIEESASEDRVDEILASFVTPNDPSVLNILKEAHNVKKEKYGVSSFEGYLSRDPNEVLKDIDALFLAAKKAEISYALPPASFNALFQRIRLPKDVLANRLGTCIDISIFFASLLEASGLKPILVLFQNHAYVGCWLDEESGFYASKEENSQVLLNNASKGFNHLVLMESTYLCEGNSGTFLESVEKAYETLEKSKNFCYAIDIASCRKDRILPIPTPKKLSDGTFSFDFPTLKESEYETPSVDLSLRRYLPEDAKGSKNRFDYWEEKLLDLNLRNRLISYKTGGRGIEILCGDADKMLSFIETHSKVSLIPTPLTVEQKESSPKVLSLPPSFIESDVLSYYERDSLLAVNASQTAETSLKNLVRKSNSALEESGCNPLFLTLGLIRWFDNEKAATHGTGAMYAPIFLLPVKAPHRKNGLYYNIEYSAEDIQLNRTAFEYFRRTYNLDFSRLIPFPRKQDGSIDLRLIYNEIRKTISPMKNWALLENTSALSLFSFAHFVMWNDLRNHRQEMMNHPIVASFIYGEKKWNAPENLVSPEELDEKIGPKDFAAPLSADSSQIKAIVDSEKGESFILDGPPGTGKSQTIANMIVNFLYHGKKVLFVAEKEVALDVVKKRLDALHLGQFVLKLANLGTPKSDILSNYSRLLELGPLSDEDKFNTLGDNLLEERKELNNIMAKLHESSPYFLSPYDAIVRYLEKEQYRTSDEIPFEYIQKLNYQDFKKAIASLNELSRLVSSFSGYRNSPFLAFQKREYSLSYRDALEKELTPLRSLSEKLRLATYNAFFKGGLKDESRLNVEAYLEIVSYLQSGIPSRKEYYLDETFVSKKDALLEAASNKEKEVLSRESVSFAFLDQAFLLNDPASLLEETKSYQSLSFFKRRKAFKNLWKRLKVYMKLKKMPKEDEFIALLGKLVEVYEAKKKLLDIDPYSKLILSKFSFENSEKASESKKELHLTLQIASAFQRMNLGESKESFFEYVSEMGEGVLFGKANETLRSLFEEFLEREKSLKENFDFDLTLYGDSKDYFRFLSEKVGDALSSIGRLSDWTNMLLELDEVSSLLPTTFLNSFKNGNISYKTLSDSYIADVTFALLTHVLSERGVATLSHEKTENAIKGYQKDILAFQNSSIVETASRISAKFPKDASSFASSTNAYQLSKLVKNGGRGCTLRFLFHEYKDLISLLTPCFMMSPATLAQYLDPDDYHFDVVIFDEASQIPTSEAVGALFRADSFVIAGDKEQMPPSNYFVSSFDNDEEGTSLSSLDEDLESLLDDAIVLHLPRKRLTWHYRSRYESLIAFSNNRFYGNSLLTFPSPSSEKGSVSYRLIKGAYERGRGINRPEAKAIVAEIIKRLKDLKTKKQSIGVVTFNEAQQNLIQDLLEKELANNPKLDDAPHGEKIFVKNLENVQGDERDVILFDVTYGPDKKGNLSLNFGPLSLKRGERRLNVAVSRAREKMIVFASFEPSAIRADNAKNEGASYLRDFLLFAKDGIEALPNRLENKNEENSLSVASFLAKDLRNLGYVVKENLGSSTFKIDLAIASKEKPEDYVLGILFDNKKSAAMSCRDRHVNEPSVLKKRSWRLLNIYSVEYLDHREEVVKEVVNTFNDALTLPFEEDEKELLGNPLFVQKPKQLPKNFRPYEKEIPTVEMFTPISDEFIQEIINHEYPLSAALLDRRIRDAYQKDRIGTSVREEINVCLNDVSPSKEICGSRTFYYPKGYDCLRYPFWRKTDPKVVPERRIVDISFIEIGNCAADILAEQGSMSLDDLAKAVSIAFGYDTLAKSYSDYLKQGIRYNSGKRNGIYLDEEDEVSLR